MYTLLSALAAGWRDRQQAEREPFATTRRQQLGQRGPLSPNEALILLIDCLTYLRSRILAESPRRGNELRRDWQETIAQFRHEVMLMAHNSAGVHQDVASRIGLQPGTTPANRFILNGLGGYKQSAYRVLQLCPDSPTLPFISRAGAGTGTTPSRVWCRFLVPEEIRKGATS